MKMPKWPMMIGTQDINLRLERITQLLDRVDNPHLNLPPTIHIAGTNGKGSTLAFIESIFKENGYNVHKYISPHLVRFNERIIVSGKEISDQLLDSLSDEVKSAAESEPKINPTFFEATTVIAFLAFSRAKADILLLETGMGGRLDATNVLPQVLMSVITPISLDHQNFLGNNIGKIASEKAGIIKKNCVLILSKQEDEAKEVILNKAQENNAQVISIDDDVKIMIQQDGWLYHFEDKILKLDLPSMSGSHQIENAACAITCCLSQNKLKVSQASINLAIKKTKWPARLEKITQGKLFNLLCDRHLLYLDGSHNIAGLNTITEFLQSKLDDEKDIKIILIFSMLQDKDYQVFLKKISNFATMIFLIEIPNQDKALSLTELKNICKKTDIQHLAINSFSEAFRLIKKDYQNHDSLILICGSLYLAGHFLEENSS